MKDFFMDLLERAFKTFVQSLLASLGTTTMAFGDVNWGIVLSTAGLATLVSVLTSLASYNVGEKGTASVK